MKSLPKILAGWPLAVLLLCAPAAARAQANPSAQDRLAREIFKELIEIDTTHATGNTTVAAEAMAARLRAAGFPAADIQVLGPSPKKGNLVARFRGAGAQKPLLLLAHLDVVGASREDWSVEPFQFLEQDDYFYGRGTTDDKAMSSIWIANLIRYRQEGFQPNRDIIVALTADEEGGPENGADWLVQNHRSLIDAEFCINEGGDGQIKNGRYLLNEVQASEKVYLSFRLEVKNSGGHSSIPMPDNAIYRLSEALARLSKFQFPVKLNEVTRAFFERTAAIETGSAAADMKAVTQNPPDPAAAERLAKVPYYNALMRNTCVATMLEAGHAENALPQTARAVVNCRLLPDESPDALQATLARVLGDGQITLSRIQEPNPSPPSPLRPELVRTLERITDEMWPGVPVVPVMSTGATDGLYFRRGGIPTYGVSGLFNDIDDNRMHGKDERIGVKQYFEGREFLYRLVKALASGN